MAFFDSFDSKSFSNSEDEDDALFEQVQCDETSPKPTWFDLFLARQHKTASTIAERGRGQRVRSDNISAPRVRDDNIPAPRVRDDNIPAPRVRDDNIPTLNPVLDETPSSSTQIRPHRAHRTHIHIAESLAMPMMIVG